jgi:hypothetical protein
MKDNMKDSIKAKGAAVKAKLKAMKDKAKGAKKCAVVLTFALCGALLTGCMDTNPASRQNSNRFGDVEPAVKVVIGEHAVSNTVAVTVNTTLGDGVLASADSAGSTETQTATPTQTTDVKPDVDLHYNDALSAGASVAASGASATKGLSGVLKDAGKELFNGATSQSAETPKATQATDASNAPSALKAKITEYFVSRGGDTSKAKLYYDVNNVLTMSDGKTTVECEADGQCRECGDKE